MQKKKNLFPLLALFNLIFFACNLGKGGETPVPASPTPPTPIIVTSVPTETPALSPTPAPASSGSLIYDDGKTIVSINPATGETQALISRAELEAILTKDRSAESYTYGYDRPFPISFSPDYSQALVAICAGLDDRYRCLFEDYAYTLASKTAVKLPLPPDTYGVYWQWSPDGSKLAGAAWSYNRSVYFNTAFFVVNSEGSNLAALGPVVNERWQSAWSPDGAIVYPLSFIANFQSFFTDGTQKDHPIAGLEGNDRIECLAFSPDASRAILVVRKDSPKDHGWVYSAPADLSEATLVTEYNIDSRYLCKVNWSPDGRFVHLRFEYDMRAETGQETTGTEPRKDKLVNVETNSLIETPKDLLACGWTPDSYLVYETKVKDGGVQILAPKNNAPVELPAEITSAVLHCPMEWRP